ncbi:MAG: ABC transporter permease [Anaerolineales bacterium]
MSSRASSLTLPVVAATVSALALMPLVYIILRASQAEMEVWTRLWSNQVPALITNTLVLLVSVCAFTGVMSVALAWLVERTDVPGRGVWRWLLALPIAIPAYVGALCYLIVLRRGGVLDQLAIQGFGFGVGEFPIPDMYSLGSATLVVGLFTYPYVYLPVAAALRSISGSLDEAARMCGRNVWGAFYEVALPLLAPALMTGLLLVGLYALSDFGTVALLRYRTFTVAIYNQFAGQVNRDGAAILSFILIALIAPLLLADGWVNRSRWIAPTGWKPRRVLALGVWRWPAFGFIALVAFLSLGLPFLVLGGLTAQAFLFPTRADEIWRLGQENLWRYGLNSLWVAGASATVCVVLAFAPAYLAVRHRHPLARTLLTLCKAGYALPGVIAGLSLILLFNQWLPAFYNTVGVLIAGFAARFLPQAAAVNESAVKQVSPTLEQAARAMGRAPLATFIEVTLPLAAPGLLASWALVFLTAMKELPTAILLRPPGFDTLPVRIWAAASESVYTQAAPPALLLITLTVVTLGVLFTRGRFGLEEVAR